MEQRTDEAHESLPPINRELVILRSLLVVLERRYPGITAEAEAFVESERLLTEAVRIRGPRATPQITGAVREAATWLRFAALLARPDRPKKRKKAKAI